MYDNTVKIMSFFKRVMTFENFSVAAAGASPIPSVRLLTEATTVRIPASTPLASAWSATRRDWA